MVVLLLKDVVNLFVNYLGDQDPSVHDAKAMVAYLESVASDLSFDWEYWNVAGLFYNELGQIIIPKKKDAIRALRNAVRETKPEKFVAKHIEETEAAALNTLSRDHSCLAEGALKNGITRSERSVQQAHTNLVLYRNEIARFKTVLALRSEKGFKDVSLIDQIKEIQAIGWYTYLRCDTVKNKVSFITPTIFVSHVLPKAGLDITVNLGQMKVELRLSDFALSVHPFKGNTVVDGYISPHVRANGWDDICWGNGAPIAQVARALRDLPQLLNLLAVILTTYGPDPLCTIQGFQEAIEAKKGRALKPPKEKPAGRTVRVGRTFEALPMEDDPPSGIPFNQVQVVPHAVAQQVRPFFFEGIERAAIAAIFEEPQAINPIIRGVTDEAESNG